MKAILLDIDGTTLLGADPLPGARELVLDLRRREIPLLWITNNTSRSRDAWLQRLRTAGMEPHRNELYTAGDATIDYLLLTHPEAPIWLVGTEGLRADFVGAGLRIVEPDDDPEVVVLAYDTTLTYARIEATAHLIRRGLVYLATHPDATCPTPEGPVPDVGSFTAMFELACGRRPQVIGKPEATMVEGALARLQVDASDAVLIGDRLTTDIRMANAAGIPSILVLTGVTHPDGVRGLTDRPTEIMADLRAVHASFWESDG